MILAGSVETTPTPEQIPTVIAIPSSTALSIAISAIVIFIVFYVLLSFALSKMAKNRGYKHSWYAYLPFYRWYVLGKLAGKIRLMGRVYNDMALVFMLLVGITSFVNVLSTVFVFADPFFSLLKGVNPSFSLSDNGLSVEYSSNAALKLAYVGQIISYIASAFSILVILFKIFVYSALFKQYSPRRYLLGTIFSCLGFESIAVLCVCNRTPVDYNAYMKQRYDRYVSRNPFMNQNMNNNGYNGFNNYNNDFNNNYNNTYNAGGNNDNYVDPFADDDSANSSGTNSNDNYNQDFGGNQTNNQNPFGGNSDDNNDDMFN